MNKKIVFYWNLKSLVRNWICTISLSKDKGIYPRKYKEATKDIRANSCQVILRKLSIINIQQRPIDISKESFVINKQILSFISIDLEWVRVVSWKYYLVFIAGHNANVPLIHRIFKYRIKYYRKEIVSLIRWNIIVDSSQYHLIIPFASINGIDIQVVILDFGSSSIVILHPKYILFFYFKSMFVFVFHAAKLCWW